ncbi:cation acetate symporter [Tundrisphaera lichenicola]|uniref:sodium/solute symporter n=1 Tax=Tundrisphaera lichenicola TaxID=2029860 RepID=UPI003EBF35B2
MSTISWIPVGFVALMTAATILLGIYATRKARTASDFFVAGRSVSVFWNASAISGEYLSAASFMGIAGLLMKNGYDALWYPVCYATGYLFLLLFIAGPLRRFGAYTIPDFAEGRFDSPTFRKVAVTFVLFIGFFYTMPQMKGAGVVMGQILNWPYWAGIVVVGVVITFNVAFGGMKGITFVQAFQYWAKLFAISIPVFVLGSVLGGYSGNMAKIDDPSKVDALPQATSGAVMKIKGVLGYPANVLSFSPRSVSTIRFPNGATLGKVSTVRKPGPGEDPINGSFGSIFVGENPAGSPETLDGPDRRTRLAIPEGNGPIRLEPGTILQVGPVLVTKGGAPVVQDDRPVTTAIKFEFQEPAEAILSGDVPNAPPNRAWLRPFGPLTSKHGYPLLYTYSLIIALICGTAGLPHILVRFYTNPDGRAAKRTTLWVMVMLGAFYVFPPVWGTLGRNHLPSLYANNSTDAVVIRLPTILQNPLWGQILSGITSAGAFAAFMSTFSGLLVSMSGALAHDIYGRILRPQSSPESRLIAFKVAAVLIGVVSMALGFLVESFDIALMVGWAFAIAACSYFPLLLLGSWWNGLTKIGAGGGMLAGGLLSVSAIVSTMLIDKKVIHLDVSPLTRSLLEQPAIWGVPLSVGVMVGLSLLTPKLVPADIHLKMLRLHAPEELGLSKNYIEH